MVKGKRLWDQLGLVEDLVDEATGVCFMDRPELGPVACDIGKDYALAALSTVLALVDEPVEVMLRVLHTLLLTLSRYQCTIKLRRDLGLEIFFSSNWFPKPP